MATAFLLRLRLFDHHEWGPASRFKTRKQRDRAAATNRIIGGVRTHSYEETTDVPYDADDRRVE